MKLSGKRTTAGLNSGEHAFMASPKGSPVANLSGSWTETKEDILLPLSYYLSWKGDGLLSTARKTPLYDKHVEYGGKIVEFGGWLLPVQYAGILEEHHVIREKVGLFDVSHMGEVMVEGPDALAFLQKLLTNNVGKTVAGQIQYSPMCYEDGGVVDDLLTYCKAPDKYLLVINAANIDKDWAWMIENSKGYNLELNNISAATAELALQGPLAEKTLQKLTAAGLADIGYYRFQDDVVVAGKKTLISRTGYTGEDGFEIYCAAEDAQELWDALMAAGKEFGIQPAGLGCRDTLRFEACMPLYGHELSAQISPLEAGLGKFVALDKNDFNGKTALAQQKEQGLLRKLVGFVVTGKGIARAGYPVLSAGRYIGTVTTGSFAPTVGKNLGLALVEAGYAGVGQLLEIEIRNKPVAAEVIKKPFYSRKEK